jgi:hypothetical protein
MKRKALILVALLFATMGSALFALDFAVGGSLIIGGTWSQSETDPKNQAKDLDPTESSLRIDNSLEYKTKSCDIGFGFFTDFTYGEFAFAFVQQRGKVYDIYSNTGFYTGNVYNSKSPGKMKLERQDYINNLIVLDLLGKYPVAVGEKMTVYPALGLSTRFSVGGNENSDFAHDQDWGFGLKGGGGFDFPLPHSTFFRAELLCYYELAADKHATIMGAKYKQTSSDPYIGEDGYASYGYHFKDAGYYVAPQLKLSVGYKIPQKGAGVTVPAAAE